MGETKENMDEVLDDDEDALEDASRSWQLLDAARKCKFDLKSIDQDFDSYHPFVLTKIQRKMGANYITVESPVLISNQTPFHLVMRVTDDVGFTHEDTTIHSEAEVPVALHLIHKLLRFRRNQMNRADAESDKWSETINPDSTADGFADQTSVRLADPDGGRDVVLCVYMDTSRGEHTCTVRIHMPLKFENLLPVGVSVKLGEFLSKRKGHSSFGAL
jgi:hypothetical protein